MGQGEESVVVVIKRRDGFLCALLAINLAVGKKIAGNNVLRVVAELDDAIETVTPKDPLAVGIESRGENAEKSGACMGVLDFLWV